MVKVRTSKIPENSPIRKIKKILVQKLNKNDIEDEDDDFSENDEDSEDDEKKVVLKYLIYFSDTGYTINPFHIHSIEKTFRLKESTLNLNTEYGMIINCGIESGTHTPKGDIEFWYKDENFRDQRYTELMKVLDEIGIKTLTI